VRQAALLLIAACGAAPSSRVESSVAKPTIAAAAPKPTRNVHGRVMLDGNPVTYVGVAYTKNLAFTDGPPTLTAIRSDDGTFAAAIPDGHWDLIIAAPGAARRVIPGVDIAGALDLGTVSLAHGHTLTGTVRDETGAPVANARVDFIANSTYWKSDALGSLVVGNISTITDASGQYTIRGASRVLSGHEAISIEAHTDDRASLPILIVDADANIDLSVAPIGLLVVSVTAPGTFYVTARAHGAFDMAPVVQGKARLQLPAGTYEIEATRSRASTASMNATVRAGATETITLAVPRLPPVAVELIWQTPCREMYLRYIVGEDVAHARCTDRVAAFPAVEHGDYLACVDRRSCRRVSVDASPAQQKIDLSR
jgi:hypothetical protein